MKTEKEVRTRLATTYVTEKEYEEIKKAAKEVDMSVSSFLREVALLMARLDFKN